MFWIIASIAFVIALFLAARHFKMKRAEKKARRRLPFYGDPDLSELFGYDTPKGAWVGAQRPLTAEEKNFIFPRIDAGIDIFLESTAKLGYTAYRSHRDFQFVLLSDIDRDSEGNPAIKLRLDPGNPWIGTEYDKGGYMTVAGLVLGLGDRILTDPMTFLPLNAERGAYLVESVANECEHIGAFFNDRALYEETSRVHSHPIYDRTGISHPYLRIVDTLRGLIGRKRQPITCGCAVLEQNNGKNQL